MKKKVVSILIGLLLISGTVSALVYHIEDAAESLKVEYAERIEEHKASKSFKIKNDVSHLTLEQIERMRSETEEYLYMRLGQDYQLALNDETDAIIRLTDEKIEEIKQYIDDLLNAE